MMSNEEEAPSPSQMETLSLSSTSPAAFTSILDPPSYADSVFRSFDQSTHSHQSNGHDPSTSSPLSPYLTISVSDPQKDTEQLQNSLIFSGSNTYYTYLITTRTNIKEFRGEAFSVRRRFREVVVLADRLAESYRGYFVPIRPDKSVVEGQEFRGEAFSVRRRFREVVVLADRLAESYRGYFVPIRPDKSVVEGQVMQKQEFVEQRRDALEKYLRKLAAHPIIRSSEELRIFLVAEGRLPLAKTTDVASRVLDGAVRLPRQLMGETTVSGDEVTQPAKGGRDLMRIFRELKQAVSNDWGGARPAVVEEDKEFLEKKVRLGEFEAQLSNVSQQAESLVKGQQDIGETIGELGLAFVKLTKFETDEAMFNSQRVRVGDMRNLATAAVKASRLYRELNAQTVKHLAKLHEYLGVMLAVNNAFSDRTSALLTVQTLLSDISSLQLRIEKLEAASSKIFGGDRSRLRKIEELKETTRATEDAKDCAVREYERIKENNKNELERLDKERHDDFVQMLKGFVVNQAGYAEKMADVWETVAEETKGYAQEIPCEKD